MNNNNKKKSRILNGVYWIYGKKSYREMTSFSVIGFSGFWTLGVPVIREQDATKAEIF